MCITQSQNVPLSCLSRPLADRLTEAAYRDILGVSYARAFSAEWNTADREFKWPLIGRPEIGHSINGRFFLAGNHLNSCQDSDLRKS